MKTEINAVEALMILNYIRTLHCEGIDITIKIVNMLEYLKYKNIKKDKIFLQKSFLNQLYEQEEKANGKIYDIAMTERIIKHEIDLSDTENKLEEIKSTLQYKIEKLKLKNEELVKKFKIQKSYENIVFLINRIKEIIKDNSK